MKSLEVVLSVTLVLVTNVAFSQSKAAPPQSDAQKSFAKLKSLAGSWESDDPKSGYSVSFRVTSNGSTILSQMEAPPDNMVTMYHLDGHRLMATHYCAVGNQPRMIGKMLPNGKTVEFDFLDGTNLDSIQDGYMNRLVLTITDHNHHSEDLFFQSKDGTEHMAVHANMHRTQ